MSAMVQVLSKNKIEHKLNGSNYLEWSKTIRVYLRSMAENDHLTKDLPQDDSRPDWLR